MSMLWWEKIELSKILFDAEKHITVLVTTNKQKAEHLIAQDNHCTTLENSTSSWSAMTKLEVLSNSNRSLNG